MITSAILGCGNISRVHLNAMASVPQAKLRLLYDPKRERAEAAAAMFGGRVADSAEEILQSREIDAVHILSPHVFHAGQVKAALEHGKHVLCEKPMAASVQSALELVRMDAYGERLCVIFQNRYNPSSVRAKEIIESGELGRIVTLKAQMTWRRGAEYYSDDWHGKLALECGGVLINQCIHTIDLMMWLGGRARRVKGGISTDLLQGVIEVEDNAHAVIEYEAGHIGLLYASNNYGVDEVPEIKIALEKATLVHAGDDLFQIDNATGERKLIASREADSGIQGKAMYGFSHPHQIREFYSDIINGRPHTISAAEAYPAVWAVSSIYESARENRWVDFQQLCVNGKI
ncbi:MAG: Gfo/Idh/MocA family oxidoreductase [Oscillospiraceae bacterium]|jgi:predicted dehydrogenase|nr:Gfo/Idh/MocA family oxidoreductase [Oscillospiraceae bacterium]